MRAAWLLLLVVALATNVKQNGLQKAKLSPRQVLKRQKLETGPGCYAELVKLLATDLKTDSDVKRCKLQVRERYRQGRLLFCLMNGDDLSKCFSGIMSTMFYDEPSAELFAKCFHDIDLQDATLLAAGLVDKGKGKGKDKGNGFERAAIDILENSVGTEQMKNRVMKLISTDLIFTKEYLLEGLIHEDEKIVHLGGDWMGGELKKQAFNLMVVNDRVFKQRYFLYIRYPSSLADSDHSSFKLLRFSCPLIDESGPIITNEAKPWIRIPLCGLVNGFFWRMPSDVVKAFYPTVLDIMVHTPGLIGWITRVSRDINGEDSDTYRKNLQLSELVESISGVMKSLKYSSCKVHFG